MTLFDDFVAAFGVWQEARPYLSLMVDEAEMRLIVALQGRTATVDETAELLGIPGEAAGELLERAYRRCIVDREIEDGVAVYRPLSFYERLDHFAKFEDWDDLPAAARRRLDRRFLDEFIARHRASVDLLRMAPGQEPEAGVPNDTVLLLPEVEAMLDAATHIVVQPCDCRRLGQNCGRPVDTCLALDDVALKVLDRGHGRRLTREEAKELVRWADRQGLMHTSDGEWRTRGLHAICNCCACDCYPFRAAQELGSKGVWPRSRYVAVHDAECCTLCGACVKRCHFAAFYHDDSTVEVDGKAKRNVLFDPDRCWGCGLCANTCPAGAIVMRDRG
jgi:Pyruvate/2-oxoacid:ferredoxin oxidoreductase delta subunit